MAVARIPVIFIFVIHLLQVFAQGQILCSCSNGNGPRTSLSKLIASDPRIGELIAKARNQKLTSQECRCGNREIALEIQSNRPQPNGIGIQEYLKLRQLQQQAKLPLNSQPLSVDIYPSLGKQNHESDLLTHQQLLNQQESNRNLQSNLNSNSHPKSLKFQPFQQQCPADTSSQVYGHQASVLAKNPLVTLPNSNGQIQSFPSQGVLLSNLGSTSSFPSVGSNSCRNTVTNQVPPNVSQNNAVSFCNLPTSVFEGTQNTNTASVPPTIVPTDCTTNNLPPSNTIFIPFDPQAFIPIQSKAPIKLNSIQYHQKQNQIVEEQQPIQVQQHRQIQQPIQIQQPVQSQQQVQPHEPILTQQNVQAQQPILNQQMIEAQQPILQTSIQPQQPIQMQQLIQSQQQVQSQQPILTQQTIQKQQVIEAQQPILQSSNQPHQIIQIQQPIQTNQPTQMQQTIQSQQPIQMEQPVQTLQPIQMQQPIQIQQPAQQQPAQMQQPTQIQQAAQIQQPAQMQQPTQIQQPAQIQKPVQPQYVQSQSNQVITSAMAQSSPDKSAVMQPPAPGSSNQPSLLLDQCQLQSQQNQPPSCNSVFTSQLQPSVSTPHYASPQIYTTKSGSKSSTMKALLPFLFNLLKDKSGSYGCPSNCNCGCMNNYGHMQDGQQINPFNYNNFNKNLWANQAVCTEEEEEEEEIEEDDDDCMVNNNSTLPQVSNSYASRIKYGLPQDKEVSQNCIESTEIVTSKSKAPPKKVQQSKEKKKYAAKDNNKNQKKIKMESEEEDDDYYESYENED